MNTTSALPKLLVVAVATLLHVGATGGAGALATYRPIPAEARDSTVTAYSTADSNVRSKAKAATSAKERAAKLNATAEAKKQANAKDQAKAAADAEIALLEADAAERELISAISRYQRELDIKVHSAASPEVAAKAKAARVAAEKADMLGRSALSKAKSKRPDAEKVMADADQADNESATADENLKQSIASAINEREAKWVASLGTESIQVRFKANQALKEFRVHEALKTYLVALDLGDQDSAGLLAELHMADAYGIAVSAENALFYLTLPMGRPMKGENHISDAVRLAEKAMAVAIHGFPEPNWAEAYSICKRICALEPRLKSKYNQWLHVMDTASHPQERYEDGSLGYYAQRFQSLDDIAQELSNRFRNFAESAMRVKEQEQKRIEWRERAAAEERDERRQMFQIFASGMMGIAQTLQQGPGGGGFQNAYPMPFQAFQVPGGISGLGTMDRPGIISLNPFAAAIYREHLGMNLPASSGAGAGQAPSGGVVISAATSVLKNAASGGGAANGSTKYGDSRFTLNLPFGQRSSYEAAVEATKQALGQTTDPAQRRMLESLIQQNQRNADLLKSDIPVWNLSAPKPLPSAPVERVPRTARGSSRQNSGGPGTAASTK